MPRGRDEAGNIWELDANGNPVRMVQPAAPASFSGGIPGVMGVVPPNPAMVAKDAREQARQDATDRRAEQASGLAAQAAAREAAQWSASHNPDGSPKVQAPSLLGDPTKTGPEYLASLPQNIRARVQQLLDGRSILTAREKGQPLGQQLMDAANQADPTFDENVSHARYVERTQYTGQGKGSQLVQAANRFARHLGDLYEASQALGGPDLGWAPLSNIATATTNSFRQSKVATYNAVLPLIQGEVQKLTKNGSATEGEGQLIMANLSPNQPADVRYSAMKELARLGRAQVEPLHQSWESAWQGSRPPPIPMDIDPVANAVFDAVDQGGPPPKRNSRGEFFVAGAANGGNSGGDSAGLGSPPPPLTPGGGSPRLPGGVPRADYSSLVGGPRQELATTDPNSKLGAFKQTYRNEFDPVAADTMRAFIRKGAPYETASAYATSHGFNPPDRQQYAAALAFQHGNPGATPNVEANRSVPTTLGERLASSPLSAAVAGAVSGGTAGISDTIGRTLAGPGWDANRQALAALNPGSDIAGNLAGGIGGAIAAPELLAKYAPGALGAGAKIGGALDRMVPGLGRITGDAAYGATYGANENPNDPIMGGLMGAMAGAGGGIVGRKAAGGLANVIAPPEGSFGPLYKAGIFSTPGQRFGGSGLAGRMVNGVEQAMQSVPVLGAAPAAARQATRDAFQVGAFNNSLKELQPFAAMGHDVPTALPSNVGPGTQAHALANDAFTKAYDTARSGMQFVPDKQYLSEAQALTNSPSFNVLNGDQKAQLKDFVDNTVVSRIKANGGALSGDQYKAASSELSRAIDTWGKNPNTAPMAEAMSDYASIFDNAARRNSDPQAVNLLDAADKGYAQFVRIQKASQMGGAAKDAGTFTPTNYAGAVKQMGGGVRSNAYSQGTALGQDYAQAGLNLKDTLADSGTPTRLAVLGGLQGAEGAGLAATHSLGLLVNPKMIGAFAPYLPGVREVTNRLIAPRQYILPPALADPLNLAGSKINQIAPFVGKAAVPGSLAYLGYAQ